MRSVRTAMLSLAIATMVCGAGEARAEPRACMHDGQALFPALDGDGVSAKTIERMAQRLLGPAFARIIRGVPWAHLWRGDYKSSQSDYFIQGFEEKLVLPALRFGVAAPAPLKIDVELRLKTDALPCVPIELRVDDNADVEDSGSVTVHMPMTVLITMSVAGLSERWELPAAEAMVGWQHEDGEFQAAFYAAGLKLGISDAALVSGVSQTVETLQYAKELVRWKGLLIRSLRVSGAHRAKVIALLAELGTDALPGDVWSQLRRLQDTGKLRAAELEQLGLLVRRHKVAPDEDATTFVSSVLEPRATETPPRLFVAGQELSKWTRVGNDHEIRVPLSGLALVRVQYAGESIGQAFAVAFGRGVRIRLREVWGPVLEQAPAGPRCGLVRDSAPARCAEEGATAPHSKVFDLREICGGMPAAAGSSIEFGWYVVPSLPGLYVLDRQRRLSFDPTFGTRAGAPSSCDQL